MISYYLRILGDENRGKILMLLMNSPLCAQEISQIIGIEQTNLSKHLKKLINNEIIDFYPLGKYKYYYIRQSLLQDNDYICCILKAYEQECINNNGHFKIFDVVNEKTIAQRFAMINNNLV